MIWIVQQTIEGELSILLKYVLQSENFFTLTFVILIKKINQKLKYNNYKVTQCMSPRKKKKLISVPKIYVEAHEGYSNKYL